jgi:hypothetical protein
MNLPPDEESDMSDLLGATNMPTPVCYWQCRFVFCVGRRRGFGEGLQQSQV